MQSRQYHQFRNVSQFYCAIDFDEKAGRYSYLSTFDDETAHHVTHAYARALLAEASIIEN
jgi:hypothetical protein